jgi:hypothetical protein
VLKLSTEIYPSKIVQVVNISYLASEPGVLGGILGDDWIFLNGGGSRMPERIIDLMDRTAY